MWPCCGVIHSFEMAGKVESSEWQTVNSASGTEKTKCGCLGWYHEYEPRAWTRKQSFLMDKNWAVKSHPDQEQLCLIETRGTFCLWITCLEFLVCLGARPEPRREGWLIPQMTQSSARADIRDSPTLSDGPVLGISIPFFLYMEFPLSFILCFLMHVC